MQRSLSVTITSIRLRLMGERASRCLRFETWRKRFSAADFARSPIATTHRFLHRCYAHRYPQAVRDLSQPRAGVLPRRWEGKSLPPIRTLVRSGPRSVRSTSGDTLA